MRKKRKRRKLRGAGTALLATAVLAGALFAPGAGAATITPTIATDDITNNGNCTLREAVQAANTNVAVDLCTAGNAVASDTIVLNAGTYLLSLPGDGEIGNQTGDLDAVPTPGSPLTIVSNLAESEIDGTNGANTDRVLEKSSGAGSSSLTLTRIRLDDGTPPAGESGGALRVVGSTVVTLNDSRVTNSRTDSRGGGMLVVDDLTLNDSIVSGNVSTDTGGNVGAGILSNGDVLLNRSVIENNAINSPDDANTDDVTGGGIAATIGSLTIVDSTIRGNAINSADISDVTIGAGIYADSINVTITNSTIEGNSMAPASALGLAGGLFYRDPSPISTDLEILNSTFSGNEADFQGGAMQMNGGDAVIRSSTFAGNTAGASRSIHYDDFGDAGSSISVGGSILSENGTTECNGPDPIDSAGFNIDRGTSCALTGTGDLASTNPSLLALVDNGGPTETRAPTGSSPAIDGIPAASCERTDDTTPLVVDQRGAPRPFDDDGDSIDECDVGAYELNRCQGEIADVIGTQAADDITGTAANDTIIGLGGDDTIDGGSNADTICAGEGDDEIGETFDGASDEFDGGPGTDELSFPNDGSLTGARIDLTLGRATTAVAGAEVNPLTAIEDARGGFGPDILVGDAGPNSLNGLGGADSITGNAGIDDLVGDAEDDSIFARDGGFDVVHCGGGTGDSAQLDRIVVDTSVTACEFQDFEPEPILVAPPNQGGGGNQNQAAPKKKCKKGQKLKKGKCVKKKRKKKKKR